MPGFDLNNNPFENLFDEDVRGDGPIANGLMVNGQGIRFAHIQYGQKGPDVGFAQNGQDVSNLWARKGSAVYSLPFNGKSYGAFAGAPTNSGGNAVANINLTLNANGTYTVSRGGAFVGSPGVMESGVWLPNGWSVGECEVMFSTGALGEATAQNGAPSFSNLSTGRGITIAVSVPAASAQFKQEGVTVFCDLRRNGGNASRSYINAQVGASGWL